MKNTKNTLFVATAALVAGLLAAFCSGCDGSGAGEVDEDGDAGDAGRYDAVRAEVGVAGDVVKQGTCTIPTSKRKVSGTDHPPTDGYRSLATTYGAVPCSTEPVFGSNAGATDCGAPVDGFQDTSARDTVFCCVKTTDSYANDPTRVVFQQLVCDGAGGTPSAVFSAGKVALCTADGIFAGWKC